MCRRLIHIYAAKSKSRRNSNLKESSDESCERQPNNFLPVFRVLRTIICTNYRNDPSGQTSQPDRQQPSFFDCFRVCPAEEILLTVVFVVLPCPKTPSKWRGGPQLPASTDRISFCRPTGLYLPSRSSFARQTTPLLSDRVPRFVRIPILSGEVRFKFISTRLDKFYQIC